MMKKQASKTTTIGRFKHKALEVLKEKAQFNKFRKELIAEIKAVLEWRILRRDSGLQGFLDNENSSASFALEELIRNLGALTEHDSGLHLLWELDRDDLSNGDPAYTVKQEARATFIGAYTYGEGGSSDAHDFLRGLRAAIGVAILDAEIEWQKGTMSKARTALQELRERRAQYEQPSA